MLAQCVGGAIILTAKYYNYDPRDVVTHIQYVNLAKISKRKPGACICQGKIMNGVTVMLTKDWFETNIEYGQSWWYCTTVQMDLKK